MPRRLLQAAATIVLVVCLGTSGHGWMSINSETRRRHIGRGALAAGRAHSLIAMPDGQVLAWGAGARGQIGDGALVDRWTPTAVKELNDVVSVTAGAAHSVALTVNGNVYAWGANTFGRLGDGTRKRRTRPVRVTGLRNVTMIAAGRAHTLALTANGLVFSWGRNSEGQLGDGTRSTSIVPIAVRGLANVTAIAAGDAHSLAVTRDGRVFAWGSNEFSVLGDGTTKDRLKPVAIALADVVSIAGGASHSLALRRNGEVYSWGRGANGELGTGSNRAASTPKLVTGVSASAIAAGRHFSAAIRRDGTVAAWGANESGQLGDRTTIRRTRPVTVDGVASVVALALGDAHALAVTASGDLRTWGEGASGRLGTGAVFDQTAPVEVASDIPDWGADPVDDAEPPQPPLITPPSGLYPGPQTVAIDAADPTDVIRYTTDGSEPTSSSPIYVQPLVVGASKTVTAKSFALNGEGSVSRAATFTIDTQPPTIVATVDPALHAGWMTTPVTVSFACADENGVATCSAPITVSRDGAGQLITGTAIDRAGHANTATVLVSLDLNPPSLVIETPADRAIVDTDEVIVTGLAEDAASGIADARCNGELAILAGGRVQCVVTLHPGRNDIILHAIDAAGHNASAAVSITRAADLSLMQLTPATRVMTIDEVGSLSLRDQAGAPVGGALWSTSDAAIVVLSDSDPPTLTAVSLGDATIRAEKDGQSAEATVHVTAALEAGATRWTLPSLPEYSSETPLFANRVDASVPELFEIGTDAQWETTLRAVSIDGEVLWQQHTPNVPLMGDSFGGLLTGAWNEGNAPGDFSAYVRLGDGKVRPWRVESAGAFTRPAQAGDGTLYSLEYLPGGVDFEGTEVFDKYVVVIDGTVGRVISRIRLERETDEFISAQDGVIVDGHPPTVCRTTRYQWAPETLGPVVGADGRGYYVVRRHALRKRGDCIEPFRVRPERTIDMGLDLVIASPTKTPQVVNLYSVHCDGAYFTTLPCDLPVRAFQVMPDGIGGTLVTWERGTQMVGPSVFVQRSMSRVDSAGDIQERFVDPQFWLELIGQAGAAITYDQGWKSIDVVSGATQWAGALPDMSPLAARPDGGLALFDWSTRELKMMDATGAIESTQPFGLDWRSVHDSGDWIGRRGSELAAVVGDFSDATRWSALRGNAQAQFAVRAPGRGIFAKSHLAKEFQFDLIRYRHVSIRVVPYEQEKWRSRIPMPGVDEYGNSFFTIGAGSGDADTNTNCGGVLVSDINRFRDVTTPPWDPLESLPYPASLEDDMILKLLSLDSSYGDDLLYACRPEVNPGFYNSNSYAHGLLDAARLPTPRRPARIPTLFPGWMTPVPLSKFQ
jgi:alpha-tubulin suppressor-like RCC1 family protein